MGEGLKRAKAAAKATRVPKSKAVVQLRPVVKIEPEKGAALYVKAGKIPEGWRKLMVYDLKAKRYLDDILEANALEGWFVQAVRDSAGNLQRRGENLVTRRVSRAIRIDRRA